MIGVMAISSHPTFTVLLGYKLGHHRLERRHLERRRLEHRRLPHAAPGMPPTPRARLCLESTAASSAAASCAAASWPRAPPPCAPPLLRVGLDTQWRLSMAHQRALPRAHGHPHARPRPHRNTHPPRPSVSPRVRNWLSRQTYGFARRFELLGLPSFRKGYE